MNIYDRDAARKMRSEGATLREIGSYFGVSYQRIQQILSGDNNKARKTSYRRHSDETIFEFICKYIAEHGYPPSIRDIGEGAGISSTSVVRYRLLKLVEKKRIEIDYIKSRGIRIPVSPGAVCPVCGRACAVASDSADDGVV